MSFASVTYYKMFISKESWKIDFIPLKILNISNELAAISCPKKGTKFEFLLYEDASIQGTAFLAKCVIRRNFSF